MDLPIAGAVAAFTLTVGAWTLWRGARERKQIGHRSSLTAVGVWTFYLLYTAGAMVVAWQGIWRIPIPPVAGWIAGGIFFIAGVALCAWGMASMRSFDRISGTDNKHLITDGAYRYSRNPQNTGWAVALVGVALAGASGAAMLFAAFFWGVFAFYARREERYLQTVFGDSYVRYCRTTGRFLGHKRKSHRLSQRSNQASASA